MKRFLIALFLGSLTLALCQDWSWHDVPFMAAARPAANVTPPAWTVELTRTNSGNTEATNLVLTVPTGGVPSGSWVVVASILNGSSNPGFNGVGDDRGNTYTIDAIYKDSTDNTFFQVCSSHITTGLQAADKIQIVVTNVISFTYRNAFAACVTNIVTGFKTSATGRGFGTVPGVSGTTAGTQILLGILAVQNATPLWDGDSWTVSGSQLTMGNGTVSLAYAYLAIGAGTYTYGGSFGVTSKTWYGIWASYQ